MTETAFLKSLEITAMPQINAVFSSELSRNKTSGAKNPIKREISQIIPWQATKE